jgi:hypothetical protein
MDFLRATRVLSALFIATGLLAIAAPSTVADIFGFDIQQASGLGYGEIGALYGGNFIGLGIVGLWAVREKMEEGPLLIAAIGVVWLCIAGGRMLVMLTRPQVAWTWFGVLSFVIEAAVGGVFLLGARSGSRVL